MLSCIVQVVLLILGIMALVTGKITLSKNKVCQGTTARILGAIAILPLPINVLIGLAYGIQLGAQGKQLDQDTLVRLAIIEGSITFGTLLLVLIIAAVTAKPPERERRRDRDYDDRDYPPDADDRFRDRERDRDRDRDEYTDRPPRDRDDDRYR